MLHVVAISVTSWLVSQKEPGIPVILAYI